MKRFLLIAISIALCFVAFGNGHAATAAIDAPRAQTSPLPTPPARQESQIASNASFSGPWVLLEAEDGIWFMNENGGGLTKLSDGELWTHAVSPNGARVALVINETDKISEINPLAIYPGPILYEVTLPNSVLTEVIDLSVPAEERDEELGYQHQKVDAAYAISMGGLAWSPDGTKLAFAGNQAGNSDVYVYDINSRKITRLTDGPTNAIELSWSADGKSVLHQAATSPLIRAGREVVGEFAAAADGSGATPISFDSAFDSTYGDEIVVTQIDEGTVLAASHNGMPCGTYNLRLEYSSDSTYQMLWGDSVKDFAYLPNEQALLVSVYDFQLGSPTGCGTGELPDGIEASGWYLVPLDGSAATFLFGEEYRLLSSYDGIPQRDEDGSVTEPLFADEALNLYRLRSTELERVADLLVSNRPQFYFNYRFDLPRQRLAYVHSDSQFTPRLYVQGFGQPPRFLGNFNARNMTWLPSGALLFTDHGRNAFATNTYEVGRLFMAQPPRFDPLLLDDAPLVRNVILIPGPERPAVSTLEISTAYAGTELEEVNNEASVEQVRHLVLIVPEVEADVIDEELASFFQALTFQFSDTGESIYLRGDFVEQGWLISYLHQAPRGTLQTTVLPGRYRVLGAVVVDTAAENSQGEPESRLVARAGAIGLPQTIEVLPGQEATLSLPIDDTNRWLSTPLE